MSRKINFNRAFTLIELLVVISIISLLLAMLIPALGKARSLSKRVVCAGNLRQINLAVHLYTQANNDIYPCSDDPNYILWPGRKWRPFVEPYLGVKIDANNPSVLYCPQDRVGKEKFESTSYAYSMTFYHTPEHIDYMGTNGDIWGTSLPPVGQKIFNVANPSDKILIGEWFSNHLRVNGDDRGWWCWEGKRNYLFADGQVCFLDANDVRPAHDGYPNPNLTIHGIRGCDRADR
jgi:prepilin-type N-terminal cleavage/methylation domain-containing protein/prepilin-type processing-associated H-X9-DG protein